ncbi:MAG: hypothetical protein CVU40_10410 [Chloroflexi bacterium HGW-Chloroflexi-2]|jgi:O-antigen/teichoic acid export membrane protein|nr:MAG: hypothetical protein CVU40_10410 [Chloroflexi bacterium HGW-Chloroflexi-2]
MKNYLENISEVVPRIIRSSKIRNTLYSLLGLFVFQFTNALVILIIARKITVLEYGQLVSIKAFVNILIVLANFGFDSWFLARANFFENYKFIWLDLFSKKIKLLIIFFLSGLLFTYFLFDNQTYPEIIFFLLGGSLIFDSLLQSIFTLQRVVGKFVSIFYLQISYSIILFITVLLIPKYGNSLLIFCLIKVLISILSVFFGFYRLNKEHGIKIINYKKNSLSKKLNIWTFYIADISAVFYERIDIFLISIFIGVSGNEIYGPAISIIFFSFFLPNAIYYVVLPLLSTNYKNYINLKNNSFIKIALTQLTIQFFFGILVYIFIKLFTQPIIIILFGSKYVESLTILQNLAIIPMIKYLNFGLGAIITSSNNQKIRTNIMISSAVINFLLNLLLIRIIGIQGAIISYIISELFLMSFYTYYSVKILRNKP